MNATRYELARAAEEKTRQINTAYSILVSVRKGSFSALGRWDRQPRSRRSARRVA